jgi:hypothetical protein
MTTISKLLVPSALLAFVLAGCHSNPSQTSQSSSDDPAAVNLANASNTTTGSENPPPPPPDESGSAQPAAPPAGDQDQGGEPEQAPSDQSAGYDDTSYDVAPEPPPPIPDYDQPPCPGDDYLWTPGYWAYAPAGYYWVPGAWVMAPYAGSLWTPGYWGWYSGRYHWYHGYWGPHIGFYGGVNYGFGYDGNGYEGGYWRDRSFYYNTSVTRVNVTVVRNVYNYRVTNNYNTQRISYNGGNGGLNYRPTPQQVAARNDHHLAPLPAQRSFAQAAMQNRAQFASENRGHPQTLADNRPVNDGRTAPAPRAEDYHPAPSPAPTARPTPNRGPEARPAPGNRAPVAAPRPAPAPGIRPQPGRPAPESRPAPRPESRPTTQPRPESRPTPQPTAPRPSASHPEARPQPESRPESRPAPQPQKPESRPESKPAPQSRPASRPAPKQPPHPQSKPEEKRPQ